MMMSWSNCLCYLIEKIKMKMTFLRTCKKRHILSWNGLIKSNAPKQDAKKLQNEETRGATKEMVASVENIEIACLLWMDNQLVSLMSTMTRSNPVTEIQIFDRKTK